MRILPRLHNRAAVLLTRFRREERGNVAMIFGLCAIAIVSAAGGAVDFARAVDARARMAAALDTAALAVGSSSKSLQTPELQSLAQKYFDANFKPFEGTVQPVQVVVNGDTISLSVDSEMPTVLLGVAGIHTLPLGVDNEVQRATLPKKMRVVLALDNTGSMASSGKMTALKDATNNFLDMLEDAAVATPDGDIRVAIVPFAREVNVGNANYTKTWIDWDQWDDNNGDWVCTAYKKKDCIDWDWQPDNHNTWNGCVADRGPAAGPASPHHDTKNTTPNAGTPATLFPARQSSSCPVRILALTNAWTTLHNKINNMTPTGNTNTTIGLAWAWQMLTGGEPMNAPALEPDTQQVILFLTDGDNTQNRWSSSQSAIDARMTMTCTNVKNANIKLYTILVIEGNETLLKNCASDPSMFYKLTNANQLVSVFESIGTELANLHLSK